MRASSVAWLAVLIAVPIACGGRFERGEGEDGGGASTSGGTGVGTSGATSTGNKPGKAGAASVGGAIGTGGATGTGAVGGFGIAGSSIGGGIGTGGGCACPDIACGPGSYPVPDPKGCCFYCAPFIEPCPTVMCPPGRHLEQLPGIMCPVCIENQCEQQVMQYERIKREMLDKYSSVGCMIDQDCSIYWEKNQCAVSCGIAIPTSQLNNLEQNLQGVAQQTCSQMCPVAVPPCDPAAGAACVQGKCLLLR